MRLLVCVALVLLSCAAPAVAADPARLGHDDPAGRAAERDASDVVTRAYRQVNATRPECRMRFGRPSGGVPLTDTEPSLAVRSVLSLFRRPPTAAERALAEANGSPFGFPGVLERSRQGVRVARTASGEEVTVAVIPRVRQFGLDPARQRSCNRTLRKIAARLQRGERPAVRREVARALRTLPGEGPLAMAQPEVAEALVLAWGNGAGGSLFDTQRFSVTGTYMTVGHVGGRGSRGRLVGLVPDGVASIELRYPRFTSRGRYRAPVDYGKRYRRTVRVQENVFSVTVPRDVTDALAPTMVWRTATGAVVRVVEPASDLSG